MMVVAYPPDHAVPLKPFALPGATYIGAMLSSNAALMHVSYPTQALAKSCKMIPVMIISVLFYGKR